MKTIISKNIIFMLISNMWTEAGLTNGSEADIHGIIYDSQKRHPSLPVALIATFNSYIGPSFLPGLGNSVPICPVTTDWHSQKMKLKRRMLPIIIGCAMSIHTLQGNTSERLLLNSGENDICCRTLAGRLHADQDDQGLSFLPFPKYEYSNAVSVDYED